MKNIKLFGNVENNTDQSGIKEIYYKPFTGNSFLVPVVIAWCGVAISDIINAIVYFNNSEFEQGFFLLFIVLFGVGYYYFCVHADLKKDSFKVWSLTQGYSTDNFKLYRKGENVASWKWDELDSSNLFIEENRKGGVKYYHVSLITKTPGDLDVFDERIQYYNDYFVSSRFKKREHAILMLAAIFRQSDKIREIICAEIYDTNGQAAITALVGFQNNHQAELISMYEEAVTLANSDKKLDLRPLSKNERFHPLIIPFISVLTAGFSLTLVVSTIIGLF